MADDDPQGSPWRRREKKITITITITITIRIGNRADEARGPTVREQETVWFNHERLDLYWEVIGFVGWLAEVMEPLVRPGDVKDQLDRASNSIALNIAEGNGKFTARDRCRYFDSAHGSALECSAGLDVLVARKKLTKEQIRPGKERLQRIVQMLIGLIKRHSTRDYEKSTDRPELGSDSATPTPS